MKILSRILIGLLILLGTAFIVTQNAACSAAKAKCEGTHELRIGLDANGCETMEPMSASEAEIDAWLKAAGVGKECYRIRFWNGHELKKEKGELDLVQCIAKDPAKAQERALPQPTGTGQTQRVMFNTSAAKAAFEKQAEPAKKN